MVLQEEEPDEAHQALSARPAAVIVASGSASARHQDTAEMDSADKTDALLSVFHERAISEVRDEP